MFNIFKDVDKTMMAKLALLHLVIIVISNALVSIPVEILGVKLTWAAFVYPIVILASDLTVRLIGKNIARNIRLASIKDHVVIDAGTATNVAIKAA